MDKLQTLTFDGKKDILPRQVCPLEGELSWQTVKDPTLALMKLSEARKFSKAGLMIAMAVKVTSSNSLQTAISRAFEISRSGRVNILSTGAYAIYKQGGPKKSSGRKRRGKQLIQLKPIKGTGSYMVESDPSLQSRFEVEEEMNPDGTLVITIITPTAYLPDLKIRHVVRRRSATAANAHSQRQNSPPLPLEGHFLLKEPYTDDLLCKALTTAANELLDKDHLALIKWEENHRFTEKEYGVNNLMVCLFYYVHVHQLNSKSSFFFRQRTQFHNYMADNLPGNFSVCSERHFRECVRKLQWRKHGFDEYIKAAEKPRVEWEKGMFTPGFWFAIYTRAAEYFEKVLTPLF